MLIDCDTCTVRGEGCADCVVTVLLGAPPGWQDGGGPTVVPLTRRHREEPTAARAGTDADTPSSPGRAAPGCEVAHVDTDEVLSRPLVELDDVERRAVRALADFGLVPPLRHQDAAGPAVTDGTPGKRHVS